MGCSPCEPPRWGYIPTEAMESLSTGRSGKALSLRGYKIQPFSPDRWLLAKPIKLFATASLNNPPESHYWWSLRPESWSKDRNCDLPASLAMPGLAFLNAHGKRQFRVGQMPFTWLGMRNRLSWEDIPGLGLRWEKTAEFSCFRKKWWGRSQGALRSTRTEVFCFT